MSTSGIQGFDAARLSRVRPWMQAPVDAGTLPGAQCLIARRGDIVFEDQVGQRDIENGLAWERDTLTRIYSMTKPITSAALLMLYEDTHCHLDTPVDTFLPEFRDMQVLVEGAERLDQVRPADTRLTLHHLLNHTSGLTYGFNGGLLGAAMEEHKLGFTPKEGPLADSVARLAEMPLAFDPGARWNYGVSTDVIGRVIEVISGQSLASFFAERVFAPLGMQDTFFEVPEDKLDRMAACYVKMLDNPLKRMDRGAETAFGPGRVQQHSGGGGLVSTIHDYLKFAEMLRGGGVLGDVRLLAPKTIELMTRNSLRGDLTSMGQPVFSEVSYDGVGFGLGVSVTLDPGVAKTASSVGDYGWGGMASTMFWVDPELEMTVIYFTQLVPSSSYPLRKEMRALAYSSLMDP